MNRVALLVLLAVACVVPFDHDGDELVDEESSELTGTTIVSLTFDDGLADSYQAGALLAARGLRATFYVPSGRIGRTGQMTRDQLGALQQQGHEIGGHTLEHLNLTTLTTAEMTRQVCGDRDALLNAGFNVTSFAYPFGAENATVQNVVRSCNYNSARDIGGLVTPGSCVGCPYANTIPPANAFQIRTNDSIKSTTTLATMKTLVTQAEQHGGGWVPIVFHHVCDGCASNAVTVSTLTAFADWLAARKSLGTEVATVHQVIGGTMKPSSTGNRLRNPSLELDANGDRVPDCWQRGGYGTNTATFTLTSNAADGSVAQRIDVTSYTSGARRLVSRQDTGTCAPAVRAGRTYTVRAKYVANVQPRLSVYYRSSAGSWVWLAESPRLPTAGSYASAQYTTPPLPSGATHLSIGLTITSTGYLIGDAYSLVEN